MRMFTFRHRVTEKTQVEMSRLGVWVPGNGCPWINADGQEGVICPQRGTQCAKNPFIIFSGSHIHSIGVLPVHPLVLFLMCPQTTPPPLLEKCSSWSPFRLSFLKLYLPVECEGWPLKPSLLDAPPPPASLLESSTWYSWFWDQPIFERCLAGGYPNPESLSNHFQPLAIARAT